MKAEINLLIFLTFSNASVNKFCRSQCYRDFKKIIKMSLYEYLIHYLNTHNMQETVLLIFICSKLLLFMRYYKISPKKY